MCFRYTLSKSQVREPAESGDEAQVLKAAKRYHYRPRGTRTSPVVRKPVKKQVKRPH